MRRSLLAIALVASVALTGCLGSVEPAKIPQQTLDEHGWEQTREDRAEIASGLGERVILSYQGGNTRGVTTVSANDVPVFDESSLLPVLVEQVERQQGVKLEETGEREIQLNNLDTTVTATVYDVKEGPADAKAVVFTAPCSSFAAVLAWGATGSGSDGGGGLPGPIPGVDDGSQDSSNDTAYQEAIDVARDVVCS